MNGGECGANWVDLDSGAVQHSRRNTAGAALTVQPPSFLPPPLLPPSAVMHVCLGSAVKVKRKLTV